MLRCNLKLVCGLVFLGHSGLVLACSGPGLQERLLYAEAFGKIALGLQAILAVLANSWYWKVRSGPGHPLVSLLLIAIHPSWYMGAFGGDCGIGLDMMSAGLFVIVVVWTEWQYRILLKSKN